MLLFLKKATQAPPTCLPFHFCSSKEEDAQREIVRAAAAAQGVSAWENIDIKPGAF